MAIPPFWRRANASGTTLVEQEEGSNKASRLSQRWARQAVFSPPALCCLSTAQKWEWHSLLFVPGCPLGWVHHWHNLMGIVSAIMLIWKEKLACKQGSLSISFPVATIFIFLHYYKDSIHQDNIWADLHNAMCLVSDLTCSYPAQSCRKPHGGGGGGLCKARGQAARRQPITPWHDHTTQDGRNSLSNSDQET